MTVTGTQRPSSVKSCVMPALFPKPPTPASYLASTLRPPAAAVRTERAGAATRAPMNEDEDDVAFRDFAADAGARTPAANWIEAIAAIFTSLPRAVRVCRRRDLARTRVSEVYTRPEHEVRAASSTSRRNERGVE
jgi:hypothetical protein